jgi:hypothetical protein
MPPADRVTVRLIPAARVADAVTGAVELDDEFYVGVSSPDDDSHYVSFRSFPWKDAVGRAAELRGRSWDDAYRVWTRMGLSDHHHKG